MPSATKVQTGYLESINPFSLASGTASAPALTFTNNSATGMFSPSAGVLAFSTGSTQNALTILSGGLVGIGTTNPNSTLQVAGTLTSHTYQFSGRSETSAFNILSETTSGAMGIIGHNAKSTNAANRVIANQSNWYGHFIRLYYDAGIAFHTTTGTVNAGDILYDANVPANKIASSDERLRITPTGSVGIGTVNPGAKLDVNGSFLAGTFGQSRFETSSFSSVNGELPNPSILVSSPGNYPLTILADTATGATSAGVVLSYYTSSSWKTALEIYNTSAASGKLLLMKSGGGVGIGTTNPSNSYRLTVNGGIFANGPVLSQGVVSDERGGSGLYISGGGGSPVSGRITIGDGTGWKTFITSRINNTNTDLVAFLDSGKVGIGTTNPDYSLDVYATNSIIQLSSPGAAADHYAQLAFKNSNQYAWIWKNSPSNTLYGGTNSWNFWQQSNASITFNTNSSERIRISADGNVGIGTTNPSTKFHIHQPADFSGITLSHASRVGKWYLEHSGVSSQNFIFRQNNGSSDANCMLVGRDSHNWWTGNTQRMALDTSGLLVSGNVTGVRVVAYGGSFKSVYPGATNTVIYNWYHSGTYLSGFTYHHVKTSIAMNDIMFRFHVLGYNYSNSGVIDCSCWGYTYGATSTIIAAGNYTFAGASSVTSYKSTDGLLCLAIYFPSSYYVGFHIDAFFDNPTGQGSDPYIVTSAYTTTSTNF